MELVLYTVKKCAYEISGIPADEKEKLTDVFIEQASDDTMIDDSVETFDDLEAARKRFETLELSRPCFYSTYAVVEAALLESHTYFFESEEELEDNLCYQDFLLGSIGQRVRLND